LESSFPREEENLNLVDASKIDVLGVFTRIARALFIGR